MEITITSAGIGSNELIQQLEGLPSWQPQHVQLILRKKVPFRTVDPTIVVAIVSTVGIGLGALITGVLQLAQESKRNTVIIQDKDSRRLEFPPDYPEDKILRLVETIREMEAPRIEIT